MTAEQQARAALRLEADNAGIADTGKYVEWLEALVLGLREERDAALRQIAADAPLLAAARALGAKWRAGGPYWQEMQDVKAAYKAEELQA